MTAAAFTPATTLVASDAASTSGRRRMWAVGAVAGVVSSLVVIALVAIAEGAGVPMEVAENSTTPEQIPLLGYGTVILGSTLVGLLLATAFARWARRPRLAFIITALVLTAVSFAFPATTTATTATKVMLEITHVIHALIIAAIAAHLPVREGCEAPSPDLAAVGPSHAGVRSSWSRIVLRTHRLRSARRAILVR